jgi:hypothetical protein
MALRALLVGFNVRARQKKAKRVAEDEATSLLQHYLRLI